MGTEYKELTMGVNKIEVREDILTLAKDGEFYKGLTISGELARFGQFCSYMQDLESTQKKFCINFNSDGGDMYMGLAFAGRIACSPSKITTIAYGCVASSAVLPYLVGSHRIISKFAYLMLHEPKISCDAEGLGSTDFFVNHVKSTEVQYKKWLAQHSKKPYKFWDKLIVHGMDIYLDADRCIEYGLADEII